MSLTPVNNSSSAFQRLEPGYCLHAVGQGALAVECREGDSGCVHHSENVVSHLALLLKAKDHFSCHSLIRSIIKGIKDLRINTDRVKSRL